MTELTYEAIVAEINKTAESKPMHNPYIYRYADIQIAIETAMQVERERIIKLLEEEGSNIFALNYLVALIKNSGYQK
jgi:hypothetical protein